MAGIADDRVRLVEGRVDRLTVHREVLTILDELLFVPVEFESPGAGVPGPALLGLLPADDARIGPRLHQDWLALLRQILHLRELVAAQRVAGVDDPLQVDIRLAVVNEAPVVLETLIAGLVGQGPADSGERLDVSHGVEHPLERRARIDADERVTD